MLSNYDAWLQEPYYDDDVDEEEEKGMSEEEWLCEDADNRYHSELEMAMAEKEAE